MMSSLSNDSDTRLAASIAHRLLLRVIGGVGMVTVIAIAIASFAL